MSDNTTNNPECPWCGGETDCEYTDIGVGMMQTTPYECVNCMAQQVGPDTKPVVEVRGGFQRGLWNIDKEGNGYWVKDDERLDGPPELCQHCETNVDLYKVYQRQAQKYRQDAAYYKQAYEDLAKRFAESENLRSQYSVDYVALRKTINDQEAELVRYRGKLNQHSESDDTTKRFQLIEAE